MEVEWISALLLVYFLGLFTGQYATHNNAPFGVFRPSPFACAIISCCCLSWYFFTLSAVSAYVGVFLFILAALLWLYRDHWQLLSKIKRFLRQKPMQSLRDVIAAAHNKPMNSLYQSRVSIEELEMLAGRFVGAQHIRQAFERFFAERGLVVSPQQQASAALIRYTEQVLEAVFGAASAKLVLASALQGRSMKLEEIATIVDEASELFDFSRGLLQGAIEHISQGISVVDKQLRLVAWNQRYIELFNFPPELIQVGRPIEEVIRFNAERGLCGEGDVDVQVEKRVKYLKQGLPHMSSRIRPDGTAIEVQGNPMPGGGFVMSFTDITTFCDTEQALKVSNEGLEARVIERTQALEDLNRKLIFASGKAELALQSKRRMLAAVSHDLMQPLNAARLFASSLSEMATEDKVYRLSCNIESALGAAEDLIGDLLDISRLESGKMQPQFSHFALDEVFSTLAAEFGVIAAKQGIDFRVQPSSLCIRSDKKLLRRVLQNFLTNAFRYNPKGRVVLGVRRKGKICSIEVWDDGAGIPEDRLQDIFDEFTHIERKGAESGMGLGLGLAIARGISRVLAQPLDVRSKVDKSTMFAIHVDLSRKPQARPIPSLPNQHQSIAPFSGVTVLCVDNENTILSGMHSLLSGWGCEVQLASNLDDVIARLATGYSPNFILSDYHFSSSLTGIDILNHCQQQLGAKQFIGAIITADRDVQTRDLIRSLGFSYIGKPLKPLNLRALLQQGV